MSLIRNLAWTGGMAALLSGAAAAALSRIENRRAAPAINAVSHIAWGGPPPYHGGKNGQNFVMGAALHTGASLFWAALFESLFGRAARTSTRAAMVGGTVTAASACVTDYLVVSRRFRPGFEAYLSRASLAGIYAALAIGLAIGARLTTPSSGDRRKAAPADAVLHDDTPSRPAGGTASYARLQMP